MSYSTRLGKPTHLHLAQRQRHRAAGARAGKKRNRSHTQTHNKNNNGGCMSYSTRLFVFCPAGSAVWPQYWLCAVCAVGHVGCCVGAGGGTLWG